MHVTKDAIRIFLVIIFSTFFLFRITNFYDLFSGSIIFVLLVFDLIESNHKDNTKSVLIYYMSWVIIALVTIYGRKSYIGPFTPIFIISIYKVVPLLAFAIKFRRIQVTRTVITKLSLISIALYLIELIINSTHGLASIADFLAIVALIELGIIFLIEKERLPYKSSIVAYLFNKKEQSN